MGTKKRIERKRELYLEMLKDDDSEVDGEEFYEARINALERAVFTLIAHEEDIVSDLRKLIQIVDPGLPNPPSAAQEERRREREKAAQEAMMRKVGR